MNIPESPRDDVLKALEYEEAPNPEPIGFTAGNGIYPTLDLVRRLEQIEAALDRIEAKLSK